MLSLCPNRPARHPATSSSASCGPSRTSSMAGIKSVSVGADDPHVVFVPVREERDVQRHLHVDPLLLWPLTVRVVGPAVGVSQLAREDSASRPFPSLTLEDVRSMGHWLLVRIRPACVEPHSCKCPAGIARAQPFTQGPWVELAESVRVDRIVEERPAGTSIEILGIHKDDDAAHTPSPRHTTSPRRTKPRQPPEGRRGGLPRVSSGRGPKST